MANEIIILDGSGAGGGGAVESFDFGQTAIGGAGGSGGSGSDNFTGTATNEVIFGDGAGGGGGDGDADGLLSSGAGGSSGRAGGGNDIINGGAGDDIIFGDAYSGEAGQTDTPLGNTGDSGGLGGLGGGGTGGAGANQLIFPNGTDGSNSITGQSGGSTGDPGTAGQSGDTSEYTLDDSSGFYNELSSNFDAIAANTYSSSTFGTTSQGEGAGDDTIDGGAGSDNLFGNGGADEFILDMEDDDGTVDTIWDFGNGSDVITIIDESDTEINITSAYDPSANSATTATQNVGSDGVVYLSDGSQLVIKDFAFDNEAPCFMNGSLIATPKGEIAVECLSIGDLVTTADGKTVPVKWMGRREISSVFSAKNTSVQPILITQGALGNGLPTADLRVSPDHAMFIDGVLIHASALVNGLSILRQAVTETFTYYHIELENHDLVLANGAAAETFVDSDARGRFDNAAEYVELYGSTQSAKPMAFPRVKSVRQVPLTLKAKLA